MGSDTGYIAYRQEFFREKAKIGCPVGRRRQIQKRPHLLGSLPIRRLLDRHPLRPKPRIQQPLARLRRRHHPQIFQHRQPGKLMRNLKCPQQEPGKQPMRRTVGGILLLPTAAGNAAGVWQIPRPGRGRGRNVVGKSGVWS